ncbi:MAG: hypothetical protein VYC39_09845 [Myxococcota bacterium]|nr:hypothetical protein [Myxococcota bacterium]
MSLPPSARALDIHKEIESIVSQPEYRLHENEAESVLEGIGSLAQEIVTFAQKFLNQLSDTNPIVFYIILIGASGSLLFLAWWNIQQLRLGAIKTRKSHFEGSGTFYSQNALTKNIKRELEEAIREDQYLKALRALFRLYVIDQEDELRSLGVALGTLDSLTVREVLGSLPKEKIKELERNQVLSILEKSFYDKYALSKEDVNVVAEALEYERLA